MRLLLLVVVCGCLLRPGVVLAFVSGGGGGRRSHSSLYHGGDDPFPTDTSLVAAWSVMERQQQQQEHLPDCYGASESLLYTTLRGGGAKDKKSPFAGLLALLRTPFVKLARLFETQEQKRQRLQLEALRTTIIQAVIAPNATVLPDDVLQEAATQSGWKNNSTTLTDSTALSALATKIKQWYVSRGYLLHSLVGATLQPETSTAVLTLHEPVVNDPSPVSITILKEMVVDPDSGNVVTLQQYQRQQQAHESNNNNNVTTTLVQASGRIKENRIAQCLQLTPGQPFVWNNQQWKRVEASGLFETLYQVAPQPADDGSIVLHIVGTEAPARRFEYGVGKSLYSGHWEGQVDMRHANVWGGGETLGLSLRQMANTTSPSCFLTYSNKQLSRGGYDVEAFSENLGRNDNDASALRRTGATVRILNPGVSKAVASASVEQTTLQSRRQESIASSTVELGPFFRTLPFGGRANLDSSVTVGTRFLESGRQPYGTLSASTRQLFPLNNSADRPWVLALRHAVTSSTNRLPAHVSQGLANQYQIRGATRNPPISSAIQGTTELRIPVPLPQQLTANQDASVVLYNDWLIANTRDDGSMRFCKSSVGVGLRKSIQGIPLQCDVTYSRRDKKLRATCGLGNDFVF